MSLGFLYDVLALLVLLLVLAGFVLAGPGDRNRHRSKYLLLTAVGLFVTELVVWLSYSR
jgi:hypothetical protein